MKDKILKYIELNPDILYYDLVKIFGLPLKDLLNLLDIKNFIGDTYIKIFNNHGEKIYIEFEDNFWEKIFYDDNGDIIIKEYSDGSWIKYKYDNNNNQIYCEFSSGYWYKNEYEYDSNSKLIYFEDSNGNKLNY